jgi:hypothetical protein
VSEAAVVVVVGVVGVGDAVAAAVAPVYERQGSLHGWKDVINEIPWKRRRRFAGGSGWAIWSSMAVAYLALYFSVGTGSLGRTAIYKYYTFESQNTLSL